MLEPKIATEKLGTTQSGPGFFSWLVSRLDPLMMEVRFNTTGTGIMDKIREAMRKRIEAGLEKSGWQVTEDQPHIDTVRCWFYSMNLVSGVRLIGAASQELYRSALTGKGIIAEANGKHPGVHPADQYLGAVSSFDSSPDQQTLEARGNLLGYLAGYARTTKTWQIAPPLNEVPGIHFIAIEWEAKNGIRVLRPAMAIAAEPLPPAKIVELASMQLAMHLDRCPQEAPIGT